MVGCILILLSTRCQCLLLADVRLVPGHLTHLMGTLIIASGAFSHLLPKDGAFVNPADVSSVAVGGSTPALGGGSASANGPSDSAAASLDAFDAAVEHALQRSLERIMVLRPRDSVQWISMLRECVGWAGDPLLGVGGGTAAASTAAAGAATPVLAPQTKRAERLNPTPYLPTSLAGVCLDLLSSLPSAGAQSAAPSAADTGASAPGGASLERPPSEAFDWSAVSLVAVDSIGTFRHHDKYRMPSKGVPLLSQVLTYLRSMQACTGCSIVYSKPVLYSRAQRGGQRDSAGGLSEAVPEGAPEDFAKRTEEWLPREWAEGHVTHRIKCRTTDVLSPSAVRLPQARGVAAQEEPPRQAVSAASCFIREAHLVKPYVSEERGTPDAGCPRVQAFVYSEAGPLVSLSQEDTALAAAEQASIPTIEQALQPLTQPKV